MRISLLAPLVLLALAAPSTATNLTFSLSPALESGDAGPVPLIFSGTLMDNDGDNSFLFLNDISVTFTPPGDSFLSKDPTGDPVSSPDTFFFANVPGDLIGDGSPVDNTYTGPIFEIYIAPNTPVCIYNGVIDILGGYNGPGADMNVLATAAFQVSVTPEPAATALTLAGLLGLLVATQRRRAAAN
jgi:MYXO-CTERM domain-containing protein